MNDFKGYPKTLGEVRSDMTSDSKDWSPRECLISLLREIDEGTLSPDQVIVITHYDETEETEDWTRVTFSGKLPTLTRLGMVEMAKVIITENSC